MERQVLLDRIANVAEPFTSGPDLLEALERIKEVDGWTPQTQAFMDRYNLKPVQAIAWTRFILINSGGLEADFLTSGPSETLSDQIRGLMIFPDNQLSWDTGRRFFAEGFVAYVEEQLCDQSGGA